MRAGKTRATLGFGLSKALLCACLSALALAGAAQAAPPLTIAGPGTGAGQVEFPAGVAVDPAGGDLFVADRNNFRIDRFDSEGSFLLAWGWGVADGVSQEAQVCGPAAEPPAPRCFNGSNTETGPGVMVPDGVAVDGAGDVWVADSGKRRRVSKFTPSGEFLLMAGKGVNKTDATNLCTAADLDAGDECGAGESGKGASQEFEAPRSLAFDPGGDLWVGDTGRLVQLDTGGAYLSQAAVPGGGGAVKSLAIDSAGFFYLKSQSLAGVRKYSLAGETLTFVQAFDEEDRAEALALDGGANVWVGDCERELGTNNCPIPYRFKAFDPAGEQLSQFGAGQVLGQPGVDPNGGGNPLAIDDARGALYVASNQGAANSFVQRFSLPEPGPLPEDQRAEDVLPSTATLVASLNPEGRETTYHFEYDTSPYVGEAEHGTKVPVPDATLAASGFDPEEVAAELEGLLPETTYHFRLVAENEAGRVEGPDTAFTTPPAVLIEAQWASDVAARSASLHALIDPLGVEARWRIEYGAAPCSQGGCEATEWLELPAGLGAVELGASFSGLEPHTTYHYRFVAEDERDGIEYTVEGEDRRFTTRLGEIGFSLPDSRVWEQVSPVDKHGGRVVFPEAEQGGAFRAARSGGALAYLSVGSVVADPEGNRALESSSVLARRAAGGMWGSRDLTPPHEAVTPVGAGFGLEYKLFSADLSAALLEPRDDTPLSPWASERAPYLRAEADPPSYAPLVVGCPKPPTPCPAQVAEHANVEAGTEFGVDAANPRTRVAVRGATPDFDHVVLGPRGITGLTPVPLFEGDSPFSLYEWSAGTLAPVSLPPAQAQAVSAELGSGAGSARGAISGDGSRIFWSSQSGSKLTALYVRDMDRGETARLDAVQPGAFGVGAVEPLFQAANASGSVALFTDTHQLTPDASESGADLYRCAVVVEEGELVCELSDLTGGFEESAEVLGLLPGVSENADRAYLVARGVLDETPNAYEDVAVAGQPNLYLWQQGGGIRFIATLSEQDEHDWGAPGTPQAIKLSAAASPSGRYLAFMSRQPLTGYDNRDAVSGERAQEVFLYDALDDELLCSSCNPSGARPVGLTGGDADLPEGLDFHRLWTVSPWGGSEQTLAAALPEATAGLSFDGASLYRPRAVHDNGRLYFNALDSLVPADSNGNGDVYQYEPEGLGSCSSASGSASVARVGGGCVSLISSGTAEGGARFLDASEGGRDVFFFTPAQLSVLDEDRVTDIYDARIGGIAATSTPQVQCLGEACQPAASAPPTQTPASAVFRGAGDLGAAPDNCRSISRRVRAISRRAQKLRRNAKQMARNPAKRGKARRVSRKSRRLAKRAQAQAKRAKRCRRAARKAAR